MVEQYLRVFGLLSLIVQTAAATTHYVVLDYEGGDGDIPDHQTIQVKLEADGEVEIEREWRISRHYVDQQKQEINAFFDQYYDLKKENPTEVCLVVKFLYPGGVSNETRDCVQHVGHWCYTQIHPFTYGLKLALKEYVIGPNDTDWRKLREVSSTMEEFLYGGMDNVTSPANAFCSIENYQY